MAQIGHYAPTLLQNWCQKKEDEHSGSIGRDCCWGRKKHTCWGASWSERVSSQLPSGARFSFLLAHPTWHSNVVLLNSPCRQLEQCLHALGLPSFLYCLCSTMRQANSSLQPAPIHFTDHRLCELAGQNVISCTFSSSGLLLYKAFILKATLLGAKEGEWKQSFFMETSFWAAKAQIAEHWWGNGNSCSILWTW